jgi:hypothetical protein
MAAGAAAAGADENARGVACDSRCAGNSSNA